VNEIILKRKREKEVEEFYGTNIVVVQDGLTERDRKMTRQLAKWMTTRDLFVLLDLATEITTIFKEENFEEVVKKISNVS